MAGFDTPHLRSLGLAMLLALAPAAAVQAQVSVSVQIGLPGAQIGVHRPSYPMLVQVPGHPVYYDPQVSANYFFYDGLYWVYASDNWYASSWYNGPWDLIGPDYVPLYVLRIPVRYYRQPPPYFRGWREDAPPRWAQHWGRDWEERRPGWDRWDHRKTPAPAPLPRYQQKYPGDRYPAAVEQQREIRSEHDRYVPREAVTRQYLKEMAPRRVEPVATPRSPSRSSTAPAAQRPMPQDQSRQEQSRPPKRGKACQPGQPGCDAEQPPGRDKGRQNPD